MGHEKNRARIKRHFVWAFIFAIAMVFGVRALWQAQADKSLLRVSFVSPKGNVPVKLEIVNTNAGRLRGLMFRRNMSQDRGMLFIFPETKEHSFYMKNTFIPLDMIFVGEDRKVVGILKNVPILNEISRTVGKQSRYVIELNGGFSDENNITEGTEVIFESTIPEAS